MWHAACLCSALVMPISAAAAVASVAVAPAVARNLLAHIFWPELSVVLLMISYCSLRSIYFQFYTKFAGALLFGSCHIET